MTKFTKLWQLLMILLISSSVLLAQAQKDVSADRAKAKVEQKKIEQKSESGFTEEQSVVLEKQGINNDMLKDEEAQKKAQEILIMNELLNPFSVNKEEYPSDAASGYTFAQSSGTYTPITGGTVVASSAPGTGLFLDDNSYAAQPIPFTFVFNGVSYTDFTVNTNGFVSFGTTIPAGATYSPISGTTAYAGCISAFSRDCDGRFTFQATTTSGSPVLTAVSHFGGIVVGEEVTATNIPAGATILSFDAGAQTITLSANATATATLHACIAYSAQIRTETLGTTPNRIHVIQFTNFKRYGTTYYGELYNCQIRLYETSNLAEVVYGTYVGNATSTTGQVGLRGATNADFNNRTTTTNWAATAAGTLNSSTCTMSSTVYPASGLTFTWTPPITPGEAYNPSPANLATAVLISTNLGWNFGANTTTYDLLFGTVNPPVTVVVSNGAAVNPGSYDPPANLLYSTTYYWQVVTKGPGGTTNGPVWSFTTSTNLPYVPTTPIPATLATGVSVNGDLSWTFGVNTETYDLFFGTVTPPVTKVVDNAAAGATGTYDPGTMSYSTTYYWQVVARNAAKAETPGPIWSFTTECGPIVTLPWTENFDAVVIPALPICWLKENGDWATTNNASSTYDADAYSGTQFLREAWLATNEYVWTPGFTLNSGTSYDFSFYWAGDTYAGWTGDVFYNTVQNSVGSTQMGTSFVVDATFTTKTYAQVVRTFVPGVTGTYYFAIRVNCPTSTPWYLSFDDFRVEPSPQCPNPNSLGATAITGTSADLTWTSYSGLSDIEFGLYGFIPTGVPTDIGKTSPYTKSPLLPSTQYSFYVRDNCGGGLYSNWVGPFSFYTACATFTAPFVEHFQNQTIPNCWETSGTQLWIFTNAWPGYGAAGLADHTGTGGSFAGVDGSGSVSITDITLLTPLIDVSALIDPALRFYLFNNNIDDASYQTLRVDLWNGSAWNNSIYFWGPTNNDPNWVEVIVALSPYTITGDIQLRFVVEKGAGSPFYDDMIIDDVYVEEAPACPNPSNLGAINITTSQADLTWVSPSGLSDIEFGTTGFTPSGTPTDVGKTSPYTKGGLISSTCYDFYVRDNCGGGEYSNWVGPYTFCTPCDAFALPYCNSFDAATFPLCWTQGYAPAVTSDRWSVSATANAGGTANEMHGYWQNVVGESWLETPVLIIPAGGALLTFKQLYDDYGAGLTLSVRYSNNGGSTWTTGYTIVSGGGNVGPETTSVPITLSGNVIIQWYMNGNHFQLDNWWIDDVCVFVPVVGTLAGNVYRYGTTDPISGASVVIGAYSGTTGAVGSYTIPGVLVGTYTVSCSATGYTGESVSGVVITDGGTTTQNFYLKWAEIVANPTLYNENVAPDAQLDKTLTLTNNAPAALNYTTSLQFLTDGVGESKAAGDILVDLNIEAATLDVGNLGAEFDGTYYYVTGSNGGVAPFKLYKLSQAGALVATYDQPTQATTTWGMRDLAYNAGKIYGGSEDGFYEFDIASGTFTTLFTGNLGLGAIRSLAYYPVTGNFLANNWSGAITEFSSAGTIIGTYTAPAALTGIYGMAWDSWNSKLWLFDQSGTPTSTFFEYDIATQALTGTSYLVPLQTGLTDQLAGGAFFSTSAVTGKAVLGGLLQGTDAGALSQDHVILMELNVTETWLSITANGSGTVPGTSDGSIGVTVHFDATGYPNGTVKTANIVINSNALNAPVVTIPVTMNVTSGYLVSGNVYYGTGIPPNLDRPMATNTTVTLSPIETIPTGADGYYEFTSVSNGSYTLTGATTKPWGASGFAQNDILVLQRWLLNLVSLNNLQKRAGDVSWNDDLTQSDLLIMKRRNLNIITSWPAPNYVFDGPFNTPAPTGSGIPVTVNNGNVTQVLRSLCSGDINGSLTPIPE